MRDKRERAKTVGNRRMKQFEVLMKKLSNLSTSKYEFKNYELDSIIESVKSYSNYVIVAFERRKELNEKRKINETER